MPASPCPTTWEEVTAAAEKLKAGGMEHPIVYEFDQELPNFFDAFVAQAYGRGGDLFDAEQKAVFDNPDNPAYKQLEWLADAFKKDLVQQETHESKVIPSMNTGKHAFTIVYNYVLAAMNNAAEQPLAGQFALAPMPGEAHATLGFTKFYSITATAAAGSGARRGGLEVRELHGRQALQGRQALGGGEGPRLRPDLALRRSRRAGRRGTSGSTPRRSSSRSSTARNGTWTEWTSRLGGLFPPAARPGDGRRGERRRGHEGRRRDAGTSSATRWRRTDTRQRRRPAPAAALVPENSASPMWTTSRFPALWLLPVLLPVAVFTIFPVAHALWTSLHQVMLLFPGEDLVGLDNYVNVVTGEYFVTRAQELAALHRCSRRRSSSCSAPRPRSSSTASSSASAALRSIVLLPWVLPGAISAVLWIWVFHPSWGVINSSLLQARADRPLDPLAHQTPTSPSSR